MINGSSCSGKSTLLNRILQEKDRYYKLSTDAQKWMFSKYNREDHYEDVMKIANVLTDAVCQMKYNILCDGGLYRDKREEWLTIARTYGYDIIEINLEVPYDILLARFEARVKDALEKKSKTIANTSSVRFKELYEIYSQEKNENAISFRSDLLDGEALYQEVNKLI